MFVQLTKELIVSSRTLMGIDLAPISQEEIFPDEAEEWSARAILAFPGEEVEYEVLFTGDRQEATEFFRICASYLNQSHQRGVIPLHEVGLMVNPTPTTQEQK